MKSCEMQKVFALESSFSEALNAGVFYLKIYN